MTTDSHILLDKGIKRGALTSVESRKSCAVYWTCVNFDQVRLFNSFSSALEYRARLKFNNPKVVSALQAYEEIAHNVQKLENSYHLDSDPLA